MIICVWSDFSIKCSINQLKVLNGIYSFSLTEKSKICEILQVWKVNYLAEDVFYITESLFSTQEVSHFLITLGWVAHWLDRDWLQTSRLVCHKILLMHMFAS